MNIQEKISDMAGLEKISLWKGLTGTVLRRGTDFVVEMYFWKQSGSVRAVLHQMLIREKRYARPWNPGLYSVRFWRQGGLEKEKSFSNRDEKYVILKQWAEYYDVIAISKILKTIWFIKNKALMEYLSDIIL